MGSQLIEHSESTDHQVEDFCEISGAGRRFKRGSLYNSGTCTQVNTLPGLGVVGLIHSLRPSCTL
jgi:hypothetical protein